MTNAQLAVGSLLGVVLCSAPAHAQKVPPGVDLSKLRGICNDVYQNFTIKDPDGLTFQYEQKVYEAAGFSPGEIRKLAETMEPTPAQVARVQAMWRHALGQGTKHPLSCDTANFDVQRGYILKYAVAMKNSDFLALAAEIWRVELNHVDPLDGRTLLDYVQKEIDRVADGAPGSNSHQLLQSYYRMLRKAGAKRRSEL